MITNKLKKAFDVILEEAPDISTKNLVWYGILIYYENNMDELISDLKLVSTDESKIVYNNEYCIDTWNLTVDDFLTSINSIKHL